VSPGFASAGGPATSSVGGWSLTVRFPSVAVRSRRGIGRTRGEA
jgi:hypothetical protein